MESQLKILLAGYGDIASRLASRLAKKGITPVAVKRTALQDNGAVKLQRGDMCDAKFVDSLLSEPCDAMVVSMTPGEFSDRGYRDSYVAVANNLVNTINRSPVKPGLVLWVSSTSVYGQGNSKWVDEKTAPIPTSFSGKRLLEAENIIASLSIPNAIVRFSGIYGPDRNRMLKQIKSGDIVAPTPQVWSNRIHSEDCARVLEHLLALHQSGKQLQPVYLATDSSPTPIYEVQHWLAEQLGVKNYSAKAPPARANRRCANKLLLASGYQFLYGGYKAGFRELLGKS